MLSNIILYLQTLLQGCSTAITFIIKISLAVFLDEQGFLTRLNIIFYKTTRGAIINKYNL